jgi:hypothetical protein
MTYPNSTRSMSAALALDVGRFGAALFHATPEQSEAFTTRNSARLTTREQEYLALAQAAFHASGEDELERVFLAWKGCDLADDSTEREFEFWMLADAAAESAMCCG